VEEELAQTKERLAKVEKALAEADVRAQAEMQNVRRRAERDVESAHKFALEKFAGDILTVADSLERGLATLDPQDEALKPAREGLELTLKVLLDVFAKYNLEQIDPQGEPFNPEHHEAMTMIPAPDVEPNSVVEVLEKGYQLNGRLIRPARVVVSKA
jgi:molecular chaperone GrpE